VAKSVGQRADTVVRRRHRSREATAAPLGVNTRSQVDARGAVAGGRLRGESGERWHTTASARWLINQARTRNPPRRRGE
jgi:hypothetical protein